MFEAGEASLRCPRQPEIEHPPTERGTVGLLGGHMMGVGRWLAIAFAVVAVPLVCSAQTEDEEPPQAQQQFQAEEPPQAEDEEQSEAEEQPGAGAKRSKFEFSIEGLTHQMGTPDSSNRVTDPDSFFNRPRHGTADYFGHSWPVTAGVSGVFWAAKRFGLGVSYSRASGRRYATLTAVLPNSSGYPDITSTATSEPHGSESAIDFPLWFRAVEKPRLSFDLFAGPSYVSASQTVFSEWEEEGTFVVDHFVGSSITETETNESSGSAMGFHAGARCSFSFSYRVGLTVQIRYRKATAELDGLLEFKEDSRDPDVHSTFQLETEGVRYGFGLVFRPF